MELTDYDLITSFSFGEVAPGKHFLSKLNLIHLKNLSREYLELTGGKVLTVMTTLLFWAGFNLT